MATQVIPAETTAGGGGGGGGGSTVTLDTYANVPASPSTGDPLICTDSPLNRVYDGSSWLDYLPGHGPPVEPMPTAGWTQVGTAPTSLTAAGGTRAMVPGAGIGAYNRGAPSTSWKARTLVRAFTPDSAPDSAFGIYLQENATSKSLGMQFNLTSTTPRIYIVNRPNGSTSQVGEVLPVNVSPSSLGFHDYVWLEAEYDAGNVGSEVVFRYSTDGVNFITFRTYNVTTYFTTAPDLTAFNFDAGGANTETVYTQFLYYETTL